MFLFTRCLLRNVLKLFLKLNCFRNTIHFYITRGLKRHCHEHRFKNSRFQNHILQQRKPTNTGPVLIQIAMQCNHDEAVI